MDLEERNKLVEDNINLVYHIVNKYFNKYGDGEEFISEGYIGLIRAANAYDKDTKLKFSTFACNCIYNEISKSLAIQNYDCRKANLNTFSVFEKVPGCDNNLTYLDTFKYYEDYSVASVSYILDIIDSFNLKDAKFICLKRLEGYGWKEIGAMLGISGESVRQKILRVKHKLIKLGVVA